MNSSEFDVADIWRRYWPLMVTAICVFVAFAFMGLYLLHRASETRNLAHTLAVQSERQRAAICAILANTPGRVPVEIQHARAVFAPVGHPRACRPLPGATPKPTPVRVYINGKPATILVNPPAPAPTQARPSPSRTASPRPTPTPSRTPHPKPKPSPSPTCLRAPLLHRHICIK